MSERSEPEDIPDDPLERAQTLQALLISRATGGNPDNSAYAALRKDFMANDAVRALVPAYVRTCQDLAQFWGFISKTAGYAPRREKIWTSFEPLLAFLEGRNRVPADPAISEALVSFDPEGVHAVWSKALARRMNDPEGAITIARTLLETVCKRILDERFVAYGEGDELPTLYGKVANLLTLAPSQHTEESFRVILGSCHQIVERLGTLRNKIGGAHGKGGRPVRPAPRHAALAVNLAGTIATFLVETWRDRVRVDDG